MTLAVKTWLVDGQTDFPGQLARLMYRSATRNGQGVVEIGDLRVEELDVPGTAVVVRDGAFTVRGAEEVWQGSYWGYNLGDEQVTLTATGSAGPRSDLVWLQIQDPTSAGGWDHDPDTDPKAYLVVTEDVSANTTTIPAGKSGIPLARIDRPASTGTVTQDNIVDLRKMVDPRREGDSFTLPGVWDTPDSVGNNTDWEDWPNGASWNIEVPEWAAQVVLKYFVFGAQYISTGGPGGTGTTARGFTRLNFGGIGTQTTRYWVNDGTEEWARVPTGGGDTIDVPQAMRGTVQTLKLEGEGEAGTGTGRLEADGGTVVIVEYEFRELPRYDVPDRSPA